MIPERFWQLLSRRLAGEATPQELDELARMVQQNSLLESMLQLHLPNLQPAEAEDDAARAEAALAAQLVQLQVSGRLAAENPPAVHPIRWKRPLLAAACVLVLLLAGWWFTPIGANKSDTAESQNEIATERGSASRILLPDGTVVWLNGDSRLNYPENFLGNRREVTLSGEAYFDVKKDARRPFIIHTDKIDIKVLGTAFNLKSYPNDEKIETVLIHGKIEVTFKDRPSEKMILHPNEKLTVQKNQFKVEPRSTAPKVEINNVVFLKDSSLQETAWMKNQLVFSDQPLSEIAKMLERRYDVTFLFTDEQVKTFCYTGSFENESLDKILDVLSLSREFSFKQKGKLVTVGVGKDQ